MSGRYTPKQSLEAVRQSWMTKDPNDPKLSQIGQVLARAARTGPKHFQQVVRELLPENVGKHGPRG